MRPTAGTAAAATLIAGAAGLSWAVTETRRFRLRFANVPVLPPGASPLRLLHLSDFHMTPTQRAKQRWIRDLASWEPDLVVITGDFLAHRHAVAPVLSALAPLAAAPGLFVLGSNDYYAPSALNPAKYLAGPSALLEGRDPLPWGDLVAGLLELGWVDLDNAATQLEAGSLTVAARGVDDPHIGLDRYDAVAGPFEPAAELRLGVAHAPYLRVVDSMAADGADLLLMGHTHGGQLCLPGYGALVTNCDLPRRYAKGQHRYAPAGRPEAETWLHVSAGLGTSPFAPVRFACQPEATLLTLVPRGQGLSSRSSD